MFRQNAFHLARTTLFHQPVAPTFRNTIVTRCPGNVKAWAKSFSNSPHTAINSGFWTTEGKRKDSAATLFKKAEEHRHQQEECRQEEARMREEEERKRREAEADIGCDNPLDDIYHRSIYSDYGKWERGGSIWTDHGSEPSFVTGSSSESDTGYDGGSSG